MPTIADSVETDAGEKFRKYDKATENICETNNTKQKQKTDILFVKVDATAASRPERTSGSKVGITSPNIRCKAPWI